MGARRTSGVRRSDLGTHFPEFAAVGRCRFQPCTHSHEPSCAVAAAVEDGRISRERFGSYLRILDSLPESD
jgi:ribosome biogenesis GTPase